MKKIVLTIVCLTIVFGLSACDNESPETRDGSKGKQTPFSDVYKACDGNDMIYRFSNEDGRRASAGGLAVIANHSDCVLEGQE